MSDQPLDDLLERGVDWLQRLSGTVQLSVTYEGFRLVQQMHGALEQQQKEIARRELEIHNAHVWLDENDVPRASKDGVLFSLKGRLEANDDLNVQAYLGVCDERQGYLDALADLKERHEALKAAARLRRNVIIIGGDEPSFAAGDRWVAVPAEDFDDLAAALARLNGEPR